MTRSSDRHALVTGASGFVGANLIRSLLARGFEVTALIRRTSRLWRLAEMDDRVSFRVADLTDGHAMDALTAEDTRDLVFHAGAEGVAPGRTAETIAEANVRGTENLARVLAARGTTTRIVFLSSCAVYGAAVGAREDAPLRGATPYARSKIAGERALTEYFQEGRLCPVILRLYTPYGPWDAPHRLVTSTLARARRGEDIAATPGGQSRDFIYIDDAIEAIIAAGIVSGVDGAVINVCTGVRTTIREGIERIVRITRSQSRALFGALPYRPDERETFDMTGNPSLMRQRLGVRDPLSFDEGVRRTNAWFDSHGSLYDVLPAE
jgi:nucleoside-diphosphate-sugar epimerase